MDGIDIGAYPVTEQLVPTDRSVQSLVCVHSHVFCPAGKSGKTARSRKVPSKERRAAMLDMSAKFRSLGVFQTQPLLLAGACQLATEVSWRLIKV